MLWYVASCCCDCTNERFFVANEKKYWQAGGVGPNWEQFWLAQVPSQLAPRSVELGVGPNWEQFWLAQVPSQLAPKSVELGVGPNWEQFRSAQVPSQLAPSSVELGAGPNWEPLVQLA